MSLSVQRISRTLVRLHLDGPNRFKSSMKIKNYTYFSTNLIQTGSMFSNIVIPNCTIPEYIWQNLDRWPEKIATHCGVTGRQYKYAELYKMSTTFAASLRKKLKISDGDLAAVMLPNLPEYPVAILGSLQAGAVITTVNPAYTAHEVQRMLELSRAKVIITHEFCFKAIDEATKALDLNIPMIIVGGNAPKGCIKFSEFALDDNLDTSCLKSVSRTSQDLAFIPHSSGTTGLPKGVELTHRNIIAANQQIIDQKVMIVEHTTASHQDVMPVVIPMFHIFGLVVAMLNHLFIGCKLITLPNFNAETFLKSIKVHKSTAMFVVPPMVIFLNKHPAVKADDLKSLRGMVCGAAPLAASDALELVRKVNNGLDLRQGYGLTETTGVGFVAVKGCTNYGSVGHPMKQMDAKIVATDTGDVLGPNQSGELWLKGPNVMRGYYKNSKANEEVFSSDGWFKTGDIAHYDDAKTFYITDRLKELIKVKGFQVPPAELEGILRGHPNVADAAVTAIPDPISGELPKAFIVLADSNTKTSEDDIKDFIHDKVVAYKRLAQVQFVSFIPKNAAGKILRKDLKNL